MSHRISTTAFLLFAFLSSGVSHAAGTAPIPGTVAPIPGGAPSGRPNPVTGGGGGGGMPAPIAGGAAGTGGMPAPIAGGAAGTGGMPKALPGGAGAGMPDASGRAMTLPTGAGANAPTGGVPAMPAFGGAQAMPVTALGMSAGSEALGAPDAKGSLGAAAPAPLNIIEELQRIRDPFKRPGSNGPAQTVALEGLESFELSAVKMVGILTGPRETRAVLLGPDSKTYIVTRSTRIGKRGGVVARINGDHLLVREQVTNILGQAENVDTKIQIQAESQAQNSFSGTGSYVEGRGNVGAMPPAAPPGGMPAMPGQGIVPGPAANPNAAQLFRQ